MTEDMNKWMDNIKAPSDLPGGKGMVTAIHPPQPITTKFGERKACQVVINGSDGSVINTKLFLPQAFPLLHPKSNLAKILKYYGCMELRDLIGKEVVVEKVGDMLWNIKAEDLN